MQIQLKLNEDFERFLDELRIKYGSDFEYINGLHPSQQDSTSFLAAFTGADTLADATVDPNANANHKDIRSFMTEKGKSQDKLFGLNKIFIEIKKKWGLRTAKQWLEQEFSKGFYLNDSTSASYMPYCYAVDLTRLATEGLFFLDKYNSQPPKHLTTFLDDLIEFVSFLSNRQSGAVGLPNVIVWSYYFWKKDCENGYYIKDKNYYLRQCFQKLIYRLNQPFLRLDQAAFTNVSIFDRHYIEALFGGVEFPDGSFVIDEVDNIIECQKVFMEVVSDIRSEQMFTYPVLTYSLLYKDGKFQDEPFARWCSDHNVKWQDSNFFISDNVGVLSNCPLSGSTKVLYWSERYQKFQLSSIKDLYFNMKRDGKETVTVLSSGKKVKCRINKFEKSADYVITLSNGSQIVTTGDHLNKVYGKPYVQTKDLTTSDYLPISLSCYEETKNLSYEDGKIVGMFLGDGSYRNKSELTFSLNPNTDKDDIEFLKKYCSERFDAKFYECLCKSQISGKDSCLNFSVNSNAVRGLIKDFVDGDSALNKGINLRALNCSKEFRKGIIDGLYTTDGGNSNRIYTSSERLKDTLIVLCASLGIATSVITDERNGRLGEKCNYCIRYYTPEGRTKREGVYTIDDKYMWFRITNIRRAKPTKVAYCFEVVEPNTSEEFMLGNGIVTHNCRLLSDTSKLEGFINSIGGTALSIGSCRVSTINLARIAYESKFNKKKYLSILSDRVTLDCKALYSMRHILQRNIEKGLLPNYQEGALEMSKQYCTVGVLGLYEVMDLFGFISTDELGNKFYTDEGIEFAKEIFRTINTIKDNFTTEFTFNVESIPAENCAGTLATADNLLFEQDKYYIYSNQWIPLQEKCTIQEKCRLSSILDKECSGGAIAHINIEGRFPTKEVAWNMLNYVAAHGVIYSAFNTKINVCKHRHAFIGSKTCPKCGEPIADQYSRVVGFYTPVSSYQKIRKKEFDHRKWYSVLSNEDIK